MGCFVVRFHLGVFLLSSLLFVSVQSHTTACNHGNDVTCLHGNATYEGVRMLLENSARWWFSKGSYETACPPAKLKTAACTNPAPAFYNIINRMRMSNDNDTSNVTQVLKVHYGVTPPGSYMGCGSPITVPETDLHVDAVHTIYTDAWALNIRPHITWNATANETYTLIFWDAGLFGLHGMWVNIPTGNVDEGAVVVPYNGPMNPYPQKNPYVLALYKQSDDINVEFAYNKVVELLHKYGLIMLNKLVDDLPLTGPVGISMVRTKVDTYTAQRARTAGTVNNCPYLRTAVMRNNKNALPWNTTDIHLSVSVDVIFDSPPMEFEACCQHHKMMRKMVHVDPRETTPVEPVYTRMKPKVSFVQTDIKDDPYFFAHRKFTLLFLDLSESSMNVTDKAIVHWQVINISHGDVDMGETTLDYLGTRVPVQAAEKRYAFLLLEQNGDLTDQQVRAFHAPNCMIEHRCNFDVMKFMKDLNLTLVGLSSFRATTDAYSRRETYMMAGKSKSAECLGVSGFSDPCPTVQPPSCAGVAHLPSLAILTLNVLASLPLRL